MGTSWRGRGRSFPRRLEDNAEKFKRDWEDSRDGAGWSEGKSGSVRPRPYGRNSDKRSWSDAGGRRVHKTYRDRQSLRQYTEASDTRSTFPHASRGGSNGLKKVGIRRQGCDTEAIVERQLDLVQTYGCNGNDADADIKKTGAFAAMEYEKGRDRKADRFSKGESFERYWSSKDCKMTKHIGAFKRRDRWVKNEPEHLASYDAHKEGRQESDSSPESGELSSHGGDIREEKASALDDEVRSERKLASKLKKKNDGPTMNYKNSEEIVVEDDAIIRDGKWNAKVNCLELQAEREDNCTSCLTSKPRDAKNLESSTIQSAKILSEIENANKQIEMYQEQMQDLTLEFTRLEANILRHQRVFDKVRSSEPKIPKQPELSKEYRFSNDLSDEQGGDEEEVSDNDVCTSAEELEGNQEYEGRKNKSSRKDAGKNISGFSEKKLEDSYVERPPAQRSLMRRLGTLLEKANDNVSQILNESKDLAIASRSRFHHLIPDELLKCNEATTHGYGRMSNLYEPQQSGAPEKLNAARIAAQKMKPPPGVFRVLNREFRALLCSQVLAAINYRKKYDVWTQNNVSNVGIGSSLGLSNHRVTGNEGLEPLSPTTGRSSSRRNARFVRSDLEEKQAIATLQLMEKMKNMVGLPNMKEQTPRAARWTVMYQDKNRLVNDPNADVDRFAAFRPWEEEEVSIFLEKFMVYHKDFDKIAEYLPGRSVPEVVRLYYAIQKSDGFDTARRKWQMRKRRERAEELASNQKKLPFSGRSRSASYVINDSEFQSKGGMAVFEEEHITYETSVRLQGDSNMSPWSTNSLPISPFCSTLGLQSPESSLNLGISSVSKPKALKKRKRVKKLMANKRSMPVLPEPPSPSVRRARSVRAGVKDIESVIDTFHRIASENSIGESRDVFKLSDNDDQIEATNSGKWYATALKYKIEYNEGNIDSPYFFDEEDGPEGEKYGSDSDEDIAPEMEAKLRAAAARARYAASNGGTNVQGRGRLPKAATDAKFQDAARRFGRNFQSIATFVGGGRNVAKVAEFWRRHSERLNLDLLADKYEAKTTTTSTMYRKFHRLIHIWKPMLMTINFETASTPNLEDVGPAFPEVNEVHTVPEKECTLGNGYDKWDPSKKFLSLLESIHEEDIKLTFDMLRNEDLVTSTIHDAVRAAELLEFSKFDSLSLLANDKKRLESFIHLLANVQELYCRENLGIKHEVSLDKPGRQSPQIIDTGRRGPRKFKWTSEEKKALLDAYSKYGLDYPKLLDAVPSKSTDQIRNLYNNYKKEMFDPIVLPPEAVHPPTRKRKPVSKQKGEPDKISAFDSEDRSPLKKQTRESSKNPISDKMEPNDISKRGSNADSFVIQDIMAYLIDRISQD